MTYECKSKDHSIVLLGNFNPKIFQPAWFAAQNLLQKTEANAAEIQIIHSNIVSFTTEWLKIQVTQERFLVRTSLEPYDRFLRDLVLGTFELLQYTPIAKMGINRIMHFQVDSIETWNKAGHKLAPKEIWKEIMNNPGLTGLQISEPERKDGLKGAINVTIEPSREHHPGIAFNVNDHIEKEVTENSTGGATEIIGILRNHWEESYTRSASIIDHLIRRLTEIAE